MSSFDEPGPSEANLSAEGRSLRSDHRTFDDLDFGMAPLSNSSPRQDAMGREDAFYRTCAAADAAADDDDDCIHDAPHSANSLGLYLSQHDGQQEGRIQALAPPKGPIASPPPPWLSPSYRLSPHAATNAAGASGVLPLRADPVRSPKPFAPLAPFTPQRGPGRLEPEPHPDAAVPLAVPLGTDKAESPALDDVMDGGAQGAETSSSVPSRPASAAEDVASALPTGANSWFAEQTLAYANLWHRQYANGLEPMVPRMVRLGRDFPQSLGNPPWPTPLFFADAYDRNLFVDSLKGDVIVALVRSAAAREGQRAANALRSLFIRLPATYLARLADARLHATPAAGQSQLKATLVTAPACLLGGALLTASAVVGSVLALLRKVVFSALTVASLAWSLCRVDRSHLDALQRSLPHHYLLQSHRIYADLLAVNYKAYVTQFAATAPNMNEPPQVRPLNPQLDQTAYAIVRQVHYWLATCNDNFDDFRSYLFSDGPSRRQLRAEFAQRTVDADEALATVAAYSPHESNGASAPRRESVAHDAKANLRALVATYGTPMAPAPSDFDFDRLLWNYTAAVASRDPAAHVAPGPAEALRSPVDHYLFCRYERMDVQRAQPNLLLSLATQASQAEGLAAEYVNLVQHFAGAESCLPAGNDDSNFDLDFYRDTSSLRGNADDLLARAVGAEGTYDVMAKLPSTVALNFAFACRFGGLPS